MISLSCFNSPLSRNVQDLRTKNVNSHPLEGIHSPGGLKPYIRATGNLGLPPQIITDLHLASPFPRPLVVLRGKLTKNYFR